MVWPVLSLLRKLRVNKGAFTVVQRNFGSIWRRWGPTQVFLLPFRRLRADGLSSPRQKCCLAREGSPSSSRSPGFQGNSLLEDGVPILLITSWREDDRDGVRKSPTGNLWEHSCGRHDRNQFMPRKQRAVPCFVLFPAWLSAVFYEFVQFSHLLRGQIDP